MGQYKDAFLKASIEVSDAASLLCRKLNAFSVLQESGGSKMPHWTPAQPASAPEMDVEHGLQLVAHTTVDNRRSRSFLRAILLDRSIVRNGQDVVNTGAFRDHLGDKRWSIEIRADKIDENALDLCLKKRGIELPPVP